MPNGGYTASCMLAAANTHLASRGQSDTVTAHFEYPNRTSAGPAVVIVDEVKLGRSLSTLHLTLWQGEILNHAPWVNVSASKRTALGYTTHTNWSTFTGMTITTGYESTPAAALPPVPDFAALKETGFDKTWEEGKYPKVFGTAGSNGNWRFFLPRDGPLSPGVLDMWMNMTNGQKITQSTLPFVVDSFPYNLTTFLASPEMRALLEGPPPGAEEDASTKDARVEVAKKNKQSQAMWFPTVLMNLEIKTELPKEGVEWVAMRVTSKQIKNGKLDLEMLVRDVEGQVVALGTQVALMVSWERNVGKKRENQAAL